MLDIEKFIERLSAKSGELLTSYNGVDMSLLPPCQESLKMHKKALIWKKADRQHQVSLDQKGKAGTLTTTVSLKSLGATAI